MFSDGGYVVAWSEVGLNQTAVRFRLFGANGIPESAPKNVTGAPALHYRTEPAIAVLAGDLFVIAWEEEGGPGERDVWARPFNRNGASAATLKEIAVDAEMDQFQPAVAPCHDEVPCDFLISWVSSIEDSIDIKVRTFTIGGPEGAAKVAAQWTDGPLGHPALATGGVPDMFLAWESGNQGIPGADGDMGTISGRSVTTGLTYPTDEFQVNLEALGNQYAPDVARMGPLYSYVVAWTGTDGAANNLIHGRLYDHDAQPVGAPFLISTPGMGQDWLPAVAGLGDSGFVVAWTHTDFESGKRDVLFRRYHHTGSSATPICVPQCGESVCGADGCGSECGVCAESKVCVAGACHLDDCLDQDPADDWDGCAGGAVGPMEVDAIAMLEEEYPAIAGWPDGSFVVAWCSTAMLTGAIKLKAQRSGVDGLPAGEAITVSDGLDESTCATPALGAFQDGGFVVVWAEPGENQKRVLFRLYGANGVPAGEGIDVAPVAPFQFRSQPTCTVFSEERFAIAWSEIEGLGDDDVWRRSYNREGLPLESAAPAHNELDGLQRHPALAACHDEVPCDYLVSWSEAKDGESEIWGRTFHVTGPESPAVQLNMFEPGNQLSPAVARGGVPDMLVVWTSGDGPTSGVDGSGSGIAARGTNTGLVLKTDEVVLNAVTKGNQYGPAATNYGPAGGYVVAWTEQSAGSSEVWARTIDDQKQPLSAPFQVSPFADGFHWTPVLTGLGDFGFAIAWTQEDAQTGNRQVVVQRYEDTGKPWPTGFCYPDPPLQCEDCCNDGLICTIDSCDLVEGGCLHEQVACDDGIDCTQESCTELFGCLPVPNDEPCFDGDPCTLDVCLPILGCTNESAPDGTPCGDGEVCDNGLCLCEPDCSDKDCGNDGCGGTCGQCEDDDECTSESCLNEECLYISKDDGSPCDESAFCLSEGCGQYSCPDGTPCPMGFECTDGLCNLTAAVDDEFMPNHHVVLYQEMPESCALSNGSALVIWMSTAELEPGVPKHYLRGRIYGADGNPASGELELSGTSSMANYKNSIRCLALDGEFLVFWISSGIHVARWNNAGVPMVSDKAATPGTSPSQFWVYLWPDGAPGIAYSLASGETYLIELDEKLVQQAIKALGKGALQWALTNGDDEVVLMSDGNLLRFARDGTVLDQGVPISIVEGFLGYPGLTRLVGGDYLAAYQVNIAGEGIKAFRSRFSPDLTPLYRDVRVAPDPQWATGTFVRPHALADGGYLVTWSSQDVRGAFHTAADLPIGEKPLIVNQHTSSYQRRASASQLTGGSILVAWESDAMPSGSGQDIGARLLAADAAGTTDACPDGCDDGDACTLDYCEPDVGCASASVDGECP